MKENKWVQIYLEEKNGKSIPAAAEDKVQSKMDRKYKMDNISGIEDRRVRCDEKVWRRSEKFVKRIFKVNSTVFIGLKSFLFAQNTILPKHKTKYNDRKQ